MHCPSCKATRETYIEPAGMENWTRCKRCHKVLLRTKRKGDTAAGMIHCAAWFMPAAKNLHEISKPGRVV